MNATTNREYVIENFDPISHATLLTKDGSRNTRKELARYVCLKFTNWRSLFDDAYPKLAMIDAFLSRSAGVNFAAGTVEAHDVQDQEDIIQLEQQINETLRSSSESRQEAQLIFDVIVPAPENFDPQPGASTSRSTEIIISKKVKVKLDNSNKDLKRELESIFKGISRLERRLTKWINEEENLESLDQMIQERRALKRAQRKFSEVQFYENSDDEDFIDVEPDQNESELAHMRQELEQKPKKAEKKSTKRKGKVALFTCIQSVFRDSESVFRGNLSAVGES